MALGACLSAKSAKLYQMGIRCTVSRSTLTDANELRNWHIYADFAHRLPRIPLPSQASTTFRVETVTAAPSVQRGVVRFRHILRVVARACVYLQAYP